MSVSGNRVVGSVRVVIPALDGGKGGVNNILQSAAIKGRHELHCTLRMVVEGPSTISEGAVREDWKSTS